ncbi:hypothetical protein [Actinoplanes sp. NPDC026619]|uniref:hypothetical protein n=1 Tax=Actinoplanes sp. NPDC026619 TaxID=3155798 RepID=UPI0033DBE158
MATDEGNGWSRGNKIAAWSLAGTMAAALFAVIQIGQGADWFCDTSLGKDCKITAEPTEPDDRGTTPPTRNPTRPPTDPTPESTGDDKPVARVVWNGKVLIHKAAGIELDTAPPSQATGPAGTIDSADVLLDNSRYGTRYRLTAMSGARFADVSADGTTDAYSCLDSLQTVPVADAPAEVGTKLCVRTGVGNVMMVRVTGDADDGLYLAVTQWH